MSNEAFQAGVARADITPPVGIRLIGYAVREGNSHSVDGPLTATALMMRGGDTTVVILAVDVAWMSVGYAAELRVACGEAAGTPAANVVINCNHTHSSPATPGYFTFGSPEDLALEAAYAATFKDGCVSACREAASKCHPARIAVGWGECHGNINRRQRTPEGGILLGEDKDGACDHSVGVLRVDDLNGAPLAIAYRYSCHTVTLGPKTNLISPDFIGPARNLVEDQLGCPSLFLQGCAGNINPASGIGQDRDTSATFKDDQVRLGHMLGGEILKVAQSLRTNRRRKAPTLVQSIAVYWLYEYEDIMPGGTGSIDVRESTLKLPLVPFPSIEEVRTERAEWAAKLSVARERGARHWELIPLIRFDHWAQARLDAATNGENPVSMEFPLTVIRFGSDFTLVALPFESMSETGTDLRAALGENTFVLGYSNGIVSYLPTPNISKEGGMESKLAYKAYRIPSELPGEWEPQVRAEVLRLSRHKEKDLS